MSGKTKLLEYHEDINSYILVNYYGYQAFIKPFNDKLTKVNIKERLKIHSILILFGFILITHLIMRKLTHLRHEII